MPRRRGRRLVLVPMPGESSHSHPHVEMLEDGEALGSIDDNESVAVRDRGSEVSVDETLARASVPNPLGMATRGLTPAVRAALKNLYEGGLDAVFIRRAWSCRLCRSFCEVCIAARCDSPWKRRFTRTIIDVNGGGSCSFCCLDCCSTDPRGGNIHKGKLGQRFQDFSEGRWFELLRVNTQSAEDASKAQSRKRRHRIVEQELDRGAARALSLVQMFGKNTHSSKNDFIH